MTNFLKAKSQILLKEDKSDTNQISRHNTINSLLQLRHLYKSNHSANDVQLTIITTDEKERMSLYDKEMIMLHDFVDPQVDDYMHTKCKYDITKCNAVKRIVHVLEYYKNIQSTQTGDTRTVAPIFEHISSFKNYTISSFMEDWYQCRKYHCSESEDIQYFKNCKEINCINKNQCNHQRRHHMLPGQDICGAYADVDYKNIVLSHEIDSIHTYLFHSAWSRINKSPPTQTWCNYPQTIEKCSLEQITHILYNGEVFNNLDKLSNVQQDIINYFKTNEFNGQRLVNLKRKQFITKLSKYCNNNKLKAQLGALYNAIIKHDLTKYNIDNDTKEEEDHEDEKTDENVWMTHPCTIKDCNVSQIIYILKNKHIFENLNKLIKHQKDIIIYIKEHELNGEMLLQLQRKPFLTQLASHLGDNKLKGQLGKLYTMLIDFDVSKFGANDNNNNNKNEDNNQIGKDNKFITSVAVTNNENLISSHYAFGEQYRYTKNFRNHPLYVTPRYNSLKQELFEYFKAENEISDKQMLLANQLQRVDCMYPCLQQILKKIICQEPVDDIILESLWMDIDDYKNDEINIKTNVHEQGSLVQLIKLSDNNYKTIIEVINRLFQYLPDDFEYFTMRDYVFFTLLDKNLEAINAQIEENLKRFFNTNDLTEIFSVFHNFLNAKESFELQSSALRTLNFINENIFIDSLRKYLIEITEIKQEHIKLMESCIYGKLKNWLTEIDMKIYFDTLVDLGNGTLENTFDMLKQNEKALKKNGVNDSDFKKMIKGMNEYNNNIDHDSSEHKYNFESFDSKMKQHILNSFYSMMKVKEEKFYDEFVKNRCQNFPSLNRIAEMWSKKLQAKLLVKKNDVLHLINDSQQYIELVDIFSLNCTKIEEVKTEIISQFVHSAKETIHKAVKINVQKCIETKNMDLCQPFIEKTKSKSKMGSVKLIKAFWYHGFNDYYQIKPQDPLKDAHIFAIICYTDISSLCTKFRETYRQKTCVISEREKILVTYYVRSTLNTLKQSENLINQNQVNELNEIICKYYPIETLKEQVIRHSKFANMGRLLYEAFVFYSSKDCKVQTLYHGMNIELLFKTLDCVFDSPISTTTASSVALGFGGGAGIVLELESCESSKYIRTLDLSLFSCFPEEEEHLIFETRLHIKNIFIPKEAGWVGEDWMHKLSLYDALTHGSVIHNKILLRKKTKLLNLLNSIMENELSNITSKYLQSLVLSLTTQNNKIWLNKQELEKLESHKLKQMFMTDNDEFGEFVLYLRDKYNVSIFPVYKTEWEMNDRTLYFPTVVTFNLSKHKRIVFSVQLDKLSDHVILKMILMETYCNKQIKVHFNVECKELNDYYTISPTELMDTKFNRNLYVEIPHNTKELDDAASISLVITFIIHNVEDFDVHYEDYSSINKVTEHNMEHLTANYKYVDFLSSYYGVCNTIYDFFQSISQIALMIFLWNCDEIVLATAMLAQMLSVQILISTYVCYQIKSQSWLKKALCFMMTFISAPMLSCLEWIMIRIGIDNTHTIYNVTPNYDGILMWVKHELNRNRLFLIKSILSLSWQIIIVFAIISEVESLISIHIALYLLLIFSNIVTVPRMVLISYNMKRSMIYFNVFSYCMDICVTLFMAIFVGCTICQNIFSFIGLYIVLEYLIFVPFYGYYISYALVPKIHMAILMLLFFCFPFAIFSSLGFSLFPLLNFVKTNPMQIGEKQKFYQTLYEWCINSKNESEFHLKMIIINYVCIQMYFDKMNENNNPQYYQFVEWLYRQHESDLRYITFETFQDQSSNIYEQIYTDYTFPLNILNVKKAQILIRALMVIICGSLDLFYLKIFNTESLFMIKYRNIMIILLSIGIILFLLWLLCWVYEFVVAKWNEFCFYMITPKHQTFYFSGSTSEFIKKCDNVLHRNS